MSDSRFQVRLWCEQEAYVDVVAPTDTDLLTLRELALEKMDEVQGVLWETTDGGTMIVSCEVLGE